MPTTDNVRLTNDGISIVCEDGVTTIGIDEDAPDEDVDAILASIGF